MTEGDKTMFDFVGRRSGVSADAHFSGDL